MNGCVLNLVNAIPLTPALSLGEREKVMQRSSSRARPLSVRLVAILLLLWGEGRGEGKRNATHSRALLRNPDYFNSLR